MKPRRRGRIDQVLAFFARSLICFLEAGSLKSYGVLVEDLTRQTRMSFAMTGLVLPLQHSLCYILAPVATALSNRIGLRSTVMVGGILTGLGYIGNGIFPLNPISLTICCTCAGVGYGIAYTPSYLNLRNVIPDDATFGTIQTLTDQFIFVGISILPPVFEKFQEKYGLQGALLLFGGLNLHIMIAGVVMAPVVPSIESENNDLGEKKSDSDEGNGDETETFLETQDDRYTFAANALSEQATTDEEASTDKSRDQTDVNSSSESYGLYSYFCFLQRNKAVAFLIMSVLCNTFTSFGWILFLIPLGKEKGLISSEAVLLSTGAGVGALFGRVWCIILFWKEVKNPFYYFGLPTLLQCLAFICLSLTANNYPKLMVISFLSGIPFGVTGAAIGGVCALKVSPADFQPALVLVFVFMALGTEIGGGVCGAVYDYTCSSVPVFLVLATSNMILVLVSVVWLLWEISNGDQVPTKYSLDYS